MNAQTSFSLKIYLLELGVSLQLTISMFNLVILVDVRAVCCEHHFTERHCANEIIDHLVLTILVIERTLGLCDVMTSDSGQSTFHCSGQ